MADLRIAGSQSAEQLVHVVHIHVALVFGLLVVDRHFLDALQLVTSAIVVGAVEGPLRTDHQHAAVGYSGDAPLAKHLLRRLVTATVVPPERDRGAFGGRGVFEPDHRTGREAVIVVARGFGDHRDRIAQTAGGEWHRQLVAGHVAQRAAAKIPPATPLEAVVQTWPVLPVRSGPQPSFPVKLFQGPLDLRLLGRYQLVRLFGVLLLGLGGKLLHRHAASRALRPHGTIRPGVHLLQIAQHAGLQLRNRFARRVQSRALIAHLGADSGFRRHLGQLPRLVDRPGQRLLGVAADAQSHRIQRLDPVHVIRGADRRHLDILAMLGEHLAVIDELLGALEPLLLAFAFQRSTINITDPDHITVTRRIAGIAATLAAHADTDHIRPLVGRSTERDATATGNPKADSGGCGDLQKLTATGSCHG